MLEIAGKYNTARIFADDVDPVSREQIRRLCDQEFVRGSRIRLMPDVHAGAGCTIGTTMTITDRVVPNLVGVDIGCGMETLRLEERELDLERLDDLIHRKIPAGFSIRRQPHPLASEIDLESLRCARSVDLARAVKSVGTLGGGNHFIEANVDEEGACYIVIHSGSRHLGLEVAGHYQKLGCRTLGGSDRKSRDLLIARLKAEGRRKEIAAALRKAKSAAATAVPEDLAYVEGDAFADYIHDMRIMQRFADLNRRAMAAVIVSGLGLHVAERFTTVHNYIDTDTDTESMILRKGAVSARLGEKILIPINMLDGSLICVGRGCEDWNCSAPHGAGRLMSRAMARKTFTEEEFLKTMEGVYTTTAGRATIDESPMAYKDMRSILANIGPTAEVVKVIRPIYNFKSGEG